MTTTLTQPFKTSAQPSKTPQDSFFLFLLFMRALSEPEKFLSADGLKEIIDEAKQNSDIETNDLSQGLQEAVAAITGLATNPQHPDRALSYKDAVTKYTGFKFDTNTPTLLNPALAKAMQADEYIAQKANYAFECARANGLDGNLFANQLWQESGFKDRAGSNAGAKGISQFIAATGARYGLRTEADFYDPWKSIDAGARHMGDLTKQFGDQRLALVAYNGGAGAITRTVGKDATIGEWMNHMAQERAEKGVGAANLWRNQTFDYVAKIDSGLWHHEKQDSARSAMRNLQLTSADTGPKFTPGGQ